MKTLFRKIFAPLLNVFEKGDEPYGYKPLNRKILLVMGVLFSGLAAGVVYVALGADDLGYYLPGVVFGSVGIICLVVGLIGTDRAVAKLWGSR